MIDRLPEKKTNTYVQCYVGYITLEKPKKIHDNTAVTVLMNSVHMSHADHPVHKSSNPNMCRHHQPFPWHKHVPCHPSKTVGSMVHLWFPGPSNGTMLPTLLVWSWTMLLLSLPVCSLTVCWMMTYSTIWTSP